jgi:hypothetical protein
MAYTSETREGGRGGWVRGTGVAGVGEKPGWDRETVE